MYSDCLAPQTTGLGPERPTKQHPATPALCFTQTVNLAGKSVGRKRNTESLCFSKITSSILCYVTTQPTSNLTKNCKIFYVRSFLSGLRINKSTQERLVYIIIRQPIVQLSSMAGGDLLENWLNYSVKPQCCFRFLYLYFLKLSKNYPPGKWSSGKHKKKIFNSFILSTAAAVFTDFQIFTKISIWSQPEPDLTTQHFKIDWKNNKLMFENIAETQQI